MPQTERAGHLERTAHEPRNALLHRVIVKRIDEINDNIRIYRLEIPERGTIGFRPGQWLDVFVPTVPKAGGFTITSSPSKAVPTASSAGYLELAIKKSPDNPAALWLWRPVSEILNSEVSVRVGGSFVWPPPGIDLSSLRKAIFVAGGMGINPLMSMISSLAEKPDVSFEVEVLYSLKDPGGDREADGMLFVDRIATIFAREKLRGSLKLFLTGKEAVGGSDSSYVTCNEVEVPFKSRRIEEQDLSEAVGKDLETAVVYTCGPPDMTDGFIELLTSEAGWAIDSTRVLFEKWW